MQHRFLTLIEATAHLRDEFVVIGEMSTAVNARVSAMTGSGHEIEFLSETRGGGAIVAPFTAASCSDQLLSWFRQRRFGDTCNR
ncbi:hypothetical protein RF55_8926 [Lasius niger]|uniref:Uncharacterized protein n=1 Tax=Lasius niger TaxID=67767 RepID=A0A0J7KLW7_LASNI|nr:hypothetical protein RF55_8926 [Lasius niger]